MLTFWLICLYISGIAAGFDLAQCGKSKVCVNVPSNCHADCKQTFSFMSDNADWIIMEILDEKVGENANYIAVGFSKDQEMGEELVTHCFFGEDGKVEAHLSYNPGKSNEPALNEEKGSLELLNGLRSDDKLYCKFKMRISNDRSKRQPAFNESYFLLFAHGRASDPEKLSVHSLNSDSEHFPTHSDTHIAFNNENATPVPTEYAKAEENESFLNQKTKRFLISFHAILMITSWFLLVAAAIGSARYLRDHWSSVTPFQLRIWFHLHRSSNVCAVALTAIAFILVLVAKDSSWTGPMFGKSSEENLSAGSIHSLAGAITIILAIIQPLGALLRGRPDSKFRPIFNWCHRTIGIAAFIFAVIATAISIIYFKPFAARRLSAYFLFAVYIAALVSFIIVSEKILLRRHRLVAPRNEINNDSFNLNMSNDEVESKTKCGAAIYATFCSIALLIVIGFGFVIFSA